MRLQRLLPEHKFEHGRELELLVTSQAAAAPASLRLDNIYKEFLQGQATLDGIAGRLAAALSEANAQNEQPIQPDRLVPLIRHRNLLSARLPSGESFAPHFEVLAGDFVIVFAEDGEKTLRIAPAKHLSSLGIPVQELRAKATANLRRRLGASQVALRDGVYFVLTPSGYGASRILLDEFWQDARSKVSGDPVFAVPDRDIILLTGSGDRKAMQAIGTMARNIARQFGHPVSDALYRYRDGSIELFAQ